ncbi:MAG: N4-gp56 family major capsid protein [Patescibacteria group bacterium]|nr:N4-gp56 family major capsid protein [Patescibacteria group bacterium]
MSVTTQTTATLTAEMPAAFYDPLLLKRLLPNLVHSRFAQKRSIPLQAGKTINIRRFESLSAATSALTEGTVPNGTTLSVTAITATVAAYGNFVQISDFLDYTAMDPTLTETAILLGENAGNSLDQVTRDAIVGGTTVQYAAGEAGRSSVKSTDTLSVTEIRKAVRTLNGNNAKPFPDGNFVGIAHPNALFDFQGDSGWINAQEFAGSGNLMTGEAGRMYGVRWLMTSNAKVFSAAGAASADVYATLIIGTDAYFVADLEGAGVVRNIVKPLGSSGTADPLNQLATSGR